MYVGTHNNSYYNTLFGNRTSSLYGNNTTVGKNASILNNFVSQLSGSGVYNQDAFGSEALTYVKDLKSASSALKNATGALSGGTAFSQKTPQSSDTDSLSVKFSGSKYSNPADSTKVMIEQLAAGQKNTGASLESNKATGLSGYQQFEVDFGGKTHQISFEASENDTNFDIQQKMADAINAKGLNLTASVSIDNKNGTSTLEIQSSKTGAGADNEFRIRDISGSAVQATGANNIDKAGQDAVYRINGGAAQTSKTNEVNLGGGLTATLKKASDQEITVSMATDTSYSSSQVKNFIDSYNDLYDTAVNNSDDPKAEKLFGKMVSISKTYANSLSAVGIGFNQDGRMILDEEKLGKAAQDGTLNRFFTENANKNFGFTNQISRLANDVSTNTARYVSASSFGSNMQDSDYATSLFALQAGNNFFNAGLMFDFTL